MMVCCCCLSSLLLAPSLPPSVAGWRLSSSNRSSRQQSVCQQQCKVKRGSKQAVSEWRDPVWSSHLKEARELLSNNISVKEVLANMATKTNFCLTNTKKAETFIIWEWRKKAPSKDNPERDGEGWSLVWSDHPTHCCSPPHPQYTQRSTIKQPNMFCCLWRVIKYLKFSEY